MNEFITFRRSDPELKKYLDGDVAPGVMAIPVETMILDRQQEVTFRLVPNEERPKVSLLQVWMRSSRFELLSLTLMPVVAVWAHMSPQLNQSLLGIAAVISLFLLHCGVMALNDVNDHLSGVDRINEKGGSRVLQNGWITARALKKFALGQLFLGVLVALPILYLRPEIALLVAVAAILAFVGGTHSSWGHNKFYLATELAVFMVLGPLLTWGMEWVLGETFTARLGWMGVIFGLLAVSYLSSRHLISIVVDDMSGLKTLPVYFGFDRSRFVIAAFFLGASGISILLSGPILFIPCVFAIVIMWKLIRMRSPLSSMLQDFPRHLLLLHFLIGIGIFLASKIGALF